MPIKEKMINKTPKGKLMTRKQNNLKAIKSMNKRKKLGQLASYYSKLLKMVLREMVLKTLAMSTQNTTQSKMGIQNGLKTVDHNLTTSFNCHLESIW